MAMLRKLVNVEVKELGDRVLEIAGSTEDKDRIGDIIRADGWQLKPFKKNPVFMWAHNYGQPPIGRALKVWVDKETQRLMFNIEFADAETYEFADTIFKLYKGGFLHATSVGFLPLDWEGKDEENPYPKWEGNVFTKQELLELSAVPVPANSNALVTARESGLITVKEYRFVTGTALDPDEALATEIARRVAIDVDAEIMGHGAVTEPEENEDTIRIPVKGKEPKPLPAAKEVSQAQLGDDIDYVHKAIMQVGLNETTMAQALDLASEIITRSSGNDIPAEILTKVGAVLNDKNKGRLAQIRELAQSVLDSAATADDSDKQLGPLELTPSPAEIRRQRYLDVAEVAQVVIAKLKGKRLN